MFGRRKKNAASLTRSESLDCRPVVNPEVTVQREKDGVVRLSLPVLLRPLAAKIARHLGIENQPRQRVIELDALGTEVWLLIDGQRSVAQIAKAFSQQRKVTMEEALAAVTRFLYDLGKRGLIALR